MTLRTKSIMPEQEKSHFVTIHNHNTDASSPLGLGKPGTSMSFFRQIFGMSGSKGPNTASRTHSMLSPATSPPSRTAASDSVTRRELLRVVLRNTLNRHGIPTTWIGAEMLLATSRGREPGIHWRLMIRHWDPRLLAHMVALQNALIVRVLAFDPLAANWLMGISWQFSLPDESLCPPMPHPGIWTSDPDRTR